MFIFMNIYFTPTVYIYIYIYRYIYILCVYVCVCVCEAFVVSVIFTGNTRLRPEFKSWMRLFTFYTLPILPAIGK